MNTIMADKAALRDDLRKTTWAQIPPFGGFGSFGLHAQVVLQMSEGLRT